MESTRRPAVLVTGLPGAGRTALVARAASLGASRGFAVGAVVPPGDASRERGRLAGAAAVTEPVGGAEAECACCVGDAGAGHVAAAAARALEQAAGVAVESPGGAAPRALAAALAQDVDLELRAVVAVVDARAVVPANPLFELLVAQVEAADAVVLRGADGEHGEAAAAALAALNPLAAVVPDGDDQAVWDALALDRAGASARCAMLPRDAATRVALAAAGTGPPPRKRPKLPPFAGTREAREAAEQAAQDGRKAQELGVRSSTYERRRPFQIGRLDAALLEPLASGAARVADGPLAGLVRIKGYLWLDSSPLDACHLSFAGGECTLGREGAWWADTPKELWPTGFVERAAIEQDFDESGSDRRTHLVLLGVGLEGDKLESFAALLDSCLVDDSELEALALPEPERSDNDVNDEDGDTADPGAPVRTSPFFA